MRAMGELDLAGKRVLIREDFNVPLKNGRITDDTRLRAGLPTLQAAVKAGARVIVLSHLGRPKEGVFDEASSLAPVAEALGALLGQPVRLIANWLEGVDCAPGEVVLCENVRFQVGEEKAASITVTAKRAPSSVKSWVMPNLRPMIAFMI